MVDQKQKEIINTMTFQQGPSLLQERFDYNADGTVLYAGFAARTILSSDQAWTIHKFTYNGSAQVTLKQVGYGAWDDRATGSITYA